MNGGVLRKGRGSPEQVLDGPVADECEGSLESVLVGSVDGGVE